MSLTTGALRPRAALISIAAFWTLYFVLLTLRAALVYPAAHMGVGSRAIVSIASMGVTLIFYLLIRRIPISRLGLAIGTAAFLALPAAFAYSTINHFVFMSMKHSWKAKYPRPPHGRPNPAGLRAPPTSLSVGPPPKDDEEEMTPWMDIADTACNGYFFFASWAALYLALCYAGEVGRLASRTAAAEAAARSAELRALRYQVNPHFLFNTLNSLSSLVMTGKAAEAETMILNLATFFRSSLVGDPTEDVPLAEEIQLQRLYLDIEGVRFPERLRVEIDLPDPLRRACVPGLILQPLIENAIKHGVARARRPVTILIAAREEQGRLLLSVEDDADAAPAAAGGEGTGVGLANVRERLQARFGDAAQASWAPRPRGGFVVALTMPLSFDGC